MIKVKEIDVTTCANTIETNEKQKQGAIKWKN